MNFKTSAPLKNTTWVSQIGLMTSVQVGQPRVRPGPISAPFLDKMSLLFGITVT